jgi:TrpR-related protein YerC/YecD
MKPRRPSVASQAEEAERSLYDAILALRTPQEAKQFIEDLCTPTERQAMADRWRVIEAIDAGIPYRTISEQTGVSVTTIGRVARCLAMGTGGYRMIYERLKKKRE